MIDCSKNKMKARFGLSMPWNPYNDYCTLKIGTLSKFATHYIIFIVYNMSSLLYCIVYCIHRHVFQSGLALHITARSLGKSNPKPPLAVHCINCWHPWERRTVEMAAKFHTRYRPTQLVKLEYQWALVVLLSVTDLYKVIWNVLYWY